MLNSVIVRAFALDAVMLVGLLPGRALAQPSEPLVIEQAASPPLDDSADDAERAAMARALFAEGLAHAREERFASAAELFARAHAIRPAPPIAYNLASALARIGRLVDAAEHLRTVLHDDAAEPDLREAASVMIERIEPRLARVRVLLSGASEHATLALDEHELASAVIGVAVPMNPGPHRLSVLEGGIEVASAALDLAEGAEEEVSLYVPGPRLLRWSSVAESVQLTSEASGAGLAAGPDLEWLAWTGAIVIVLGAAALTTTLLVVDQEGRAPPAPIPGTTLPAVLEWH